MINLKIKSKYVLNMIKGLTLNELHRINVKKIKSFTRQKNVYFLSVKYLFYNINIKNE